MRKRASWREKLYPIFFELAEFNLQFEREWKDMQIKHLKRLLALGKSPDPELWQEASREFQAKGQELLDEKTEQLGEINRRHLPGPIAYNPLAYSYLEIRAGEPPDEAEISPHTYIGLAITNLFARQLRKIRKGTSRHTVNSRAQERIFAASHSRRDRSSRSKVTKYIANCSNWSSALKGSA